MHYIDCMIEVVVPNCTETSRYIRTSELVGKGLVFVMHITCISLHVVKTIVEPMAAYELFARSCYSFEVTVRRKNAAELCQDTALFWSSRPKLSQQMQRSPE